MRQKCSAHAVRTDSRCTKWALPGSRYCLAHQSWGFNVLGAVVSLILGAVLGVLIQAAFDWAVESPEQRELRKLRQQYAEDQKQPAFEFLLDGKRLFADSIVLFRTTEADVSLELGVHNTGSLSSRELLVTLRYPRAAANVHPAPGWQEQPPKFIGKADVEQEPHLRFFSYRTSEMVPPGDALALPKISITNPQKDSPLLPFGLQVDSDKSDGLLHRLHVVFSVGSEELTVHEIEPGTDLKSFLQRSVHQGTRGSK